MFKAAALFLLSSFAISDIDAFSTSGRFGRCAAKVAADHGLKMFPMKKKAAAAPAESDEPVHYARTNTDIQNILDQNKAWAEKKKTKLPTFFDTLGKVHQPAYMWVGCSDARVPPNVVMGEDPGSVFVVRNVANMVVNTDFNLMSALEYATAVLKVSHIIVCGHYECGGVIASTKNVDHQPPLENWLRNIRDVYRLHRDELDAISDPVARHRALVETNAIEQAINIFKTAVVQKRRLETLGDDDAPYTAPAVHACVFDPNTGILRELEVDFEKYADELENIYALYGVE